jgi:SpoVK/Ycf46/Vps4 family AAA+-type ATPase
MVTTMNLLEQKHPNKESKRSYDNLIAIDEQKDGLLEQLNLLFNKNQLEEWRKKYHSKELPIFDLTQNSTPLIILSGEVGCGKTALAQSIATPLAVKLKKDVLVIFSPSNIRGSGLVGEISNRITEVFQSFAAKVKDNQCGLLIIDEADDLATSRSQNQAHHEDRAGLNVLIKQIDMIAQQSKQLAVIMITNRIDVLDPAVLRRATSTIEFERPKGNRLQEVLQFILRGCTKYDENEFQYLVKVIEKFHIPFSFSDIIHQAGRKAMIKAYQNNEPYSINHLIDSFNYISPTPLLKINNQII